MPNCPECNTPSAYVGFTVVECLNPQCRHYVCAHGASGQNNQAFSGASPLSPEIQVLVDEFMNDEFPREVESIQNVVGNAIPVTMDFRNVGANVDAARRLIRVLRRVRSTLCLRSGQYKEALRSGIQRVAIRHTAPGERRACTLANAVLDMIVSVDDQKTQPGPNGGMEYNEDDVDLMVADALDLELGPAVRRLQEWLLEYIAEANEALRLAIRLDVDWKSFTSHPDNRVNLQVIGSLETELHRHILYWLRSHAANDKEFRKQLKKALNALRVEHVTRAAQREMFVDGATIIYRMCLTEDGGAWGYELGDVLMAAVMSVQPAPAAADVQAWMAQQGNAMRQRIAKISDASARAVLEVFLTRDLPAAGLRIQSTVAFPVALSLDGEYLGQNPALVPHVIPRVLKRICGALAIVKKTEAHVALLKDGALMAVEVSFVADPAAKRCVFDAQTLRLSVCAEQPGAGCFDENEMAQALNEKFAVETRLREVKIKIPETAERLCEKIGSWIDIDIEWDGFLAHKDSGKLQLTLMELGNVGLDWVYYALTGQCEESADFREKLLDRVRGIRFVHAPNAKAKNISAEGSTLVYHLFLHDGYDGRFIIDHLKEIFEEVVETMAPGAPVSKKVTDELDRCEQVVVQAMQDALFEALGVSVFIKIDRKSIGNNLLAARQLGTAGLKPVVDAILDLARDNESKRKLTESLKVIRVRREDNRDGNRCGLKDGELSVDTCLDANGSDGVSSSDVYNTLRETLAEDEDEREECDERDEDDEDSDERSSNASDAGEQLKQIREQGLDKILGMYNQMNGTSILLDGDWDAFEEFLKADRNGNAQICLYSGPQIFLSAIIQLSMMTPPFAEAFKSDVKVIRFACARPGQGTDLKFEGGILTCRLNPADGMAGGFDQSELFEKLQRTILKDRLR